MSGNLFNTARVDTKYYEIIRDHVLTKFYDCFVEDIKSVKEKTSHGDLDILVGISDKFTEEDAVYKIFDRLPCTESKKFNGSLSVVFSGFAVDFIFVPEDELILKKVLLNYAPIGTLLGKMARYYGMKLSHKGLFYREKTPSGWQDIFLTKDLIKILDLFGLDYTKYGCFDTYKDAYGWVLSSPYWNKAMFEIGLMTSKERNRLNKVKHYANFLEYLNDIPDNPAKKFIKRRDIEKVSNICLTTRIAELHVEEDRKRTIKSMYNGAIVSEATGLKDKELGKFMQFVRELHGGKDNLDNFIERTYMYIRYYIDVWYIHYKNAQNDKKKGNIEI